MTATEFHEGDRVYVVDPGLTELRAIMRSFGETPKPNHHGTIHGRLGDDLDIWFDSEEYGKGKGQSAPYPPEQVRHFPDPEYPDAT